MSSILLAFALDAWWDQRAEARTVTAHLHALRSDFQQNVTRLQSFISSVAQRAGADVRFNRQLLADPKFREHVALRYFAERDVANAYRGLLEKAERVLHLTEQALR
ncbi:MAG: hypothetical protein ACRENP_17830 [Longimicrobiales bacterium]